MDVIKRINDLLSLRGWTPYKLAQKADISQSTLTNMNTRGTIPSIATIEDICKGFGISLSEFFAEEGEPMILDAEQMEMLNCWNTLSPEMKQALLVLLKGVRPE